MAQTLRTSDGSRPGDEKSLNVNLPGVDLLMEARYFCDDPNPTVMTGYTSDMDLDLRSYNDRRS